MSHVVKRQRKVAVHKPARHPATLQRKQALESGTDGWPDVTGLAVSKSLPAARTALPSCRWGPSGYAPEKMFRVTVRSHLGLPFTWEMRVSQAEDKPKPTEIPVTLIICQKTQGDGKAYYILCLL